MKPQKSFKMKPKKLINQINSSILYNWLDFVTDNVDLIFTCSIKSFVCKKQENIQESFVSYF